MSDRRGAALLRLLLIVGAVGGAAVWAGLSGTVPGAAVLASVQGAASVAALGVAGLALVRLRVEGDPRFRIVAVGFLGIGLLHLLASALAALGPGFEGSLGWAGLAPALLFAALLFAVSNASTSAAPSRPDEGPGSVRGDRGVRASAVLLPVTLLLCVLPFLLRTVPAYRPGTFPPAPFEWIPGVLLVAVALHLAVSRRLPRDTFLDGLVPAALLGGLAHLAVRGFSTQPVDLGAALGTLLLLGAWLWLGAGSIAWASEALRRIRETEASLRRATHAVRREIRDREGLQRELGEVEAHLRDLLDHAQDLIHSTDAEGRIVQVNESWKRRMGFAEAELTQRTIFDLLHPTSKATYREAMGRSARGESVEDLHLVLLARDGTPVVCSGSARARLEGGRSRVTRCILRDRSDERRAEVELRRFQANLQAVFESTGDAIWSVDRRYRLLTFNTAYALLLEVITGRGPDVGDPLESLVSAEALEWFRGCYDRALAGSRFSAVREERVDGQLRVFELYFNPIEGAEGGPTGVVVFSRDVTRRRKVEEALRSAKRDAEEASRTKSQFLANMSHELRTPLNSIIGFANILLKKHGDEMEARERGFLERILVNGKHLLTLINEILDLSKIEAGRMELQLESVDLRKLAQETLAQIEPQVAGTAVRLHWEVEGDPAPFRTDRGKLKQVIINLVANALKFTEEGTVTVRIRTEGDGRTPSVIDVEDTGIGIPEDRLEAIFHAFQQADSGTARRFGGTGLGLTISRSLCSLMGYGLEVRSEVGAGSTFSVLLAPGSESPEDRRLEALDHPPTARWSGDLLPPDRILRGKKVLVVDDEADSRDLLSHYLQDLGCEVITAVDGVEGLEVARRESPDLITVDLMMPRMSGWDLLRAIREDGRLRDTPVVVVSIVAEEGGGQVLGAVDLLTKPVERDDLARILSRNLAEGVGRVLVVEDNPDQRMLLMRYLKEAGLQVDGVENGREALEHLDRHPVDLVLLDLVMPGMDGLEFLDRMRRSKDLVRIPVAVLTAKDLEASESALLANHGVNVIQKGADVEEHLRSVLDRFFDPVMER